MIVEEIMKRDVISLSKDHSLRDAIRVMNENNIRHIPITDEKRRLIGLVTDRDLKEAGPSSLLHDEKDNILDKPLSSIMKTDLITGHPLDFVEEVAAIFYEKKIGCLPIVSGEKLVGIITETDIFHTLVQLTGVHWPSSRIEIKVPNVQGKISEVVSCIEKHHVNILSILVHPDKKDENYKIMVIRVQTINPGKIIADLKKNGHEVQWPHFSGSLS